MTPDAWRLIFEGAVAVFALAGFVLSLVGLWYTWWSGRPRVRVRMSPAFLSGVGGAGPTLFMIRAYNEGRVPVALTSVGIDIYDRGTADSTAVFLAPPPFSPPLTFVLEPGRAWDYHIDPEDVLRVHRSDQGPVLGPFVNDEGGHHWSSKSKRSWLDDWARRTTV
jgi:hypothetical protein